VEDNRCTVPFTEPFTVRLQDRHVTACCKLPEHYFDVSSKLLTPKIIELRKSILNNERHPDCASCWKKDDENGLSYRRHASRHIRFPLDWNEDTWKTLDPYQSVKSIQIAFSNKCQMMCVYCHPRISSMWEDSAEKFSIYENRRIAIHHLPEVDLNKILDTEELMYIGITGGEPMLELPAIKFLEELEPNNNRRMAITTNLSYGNVVFNKLLGIIDRHKHIDVMSSIDSIEKTPSRKYLNWDLWKKNFEILVEGFPERHKLFPDIRIGVIITVNILTYKDIQSVIEYILSFRRKGINPVFIINPVDDDNIVSLRSGRLDPNFSIQLSDEDAKYLTKPEKIRIDAFNKFIKGCTVDEELEKCSQKFLNEYLE